MTTSIKPVERIPRIVRPLLRVAAALALVYYAWMIFDLVTHPFSLGNSPGMPYLFRWLTAMTGTLTVSVAVFIMRRVPRNIIGLLLLLWGVGAAIWSLRAARGHWPGAGELCSLFHRRGLPGPGRLDFPFSNR
jgi:hypothetical protein